jgi:DNA-binding response OmpR family regulator
MHKVVAEVLVVEDEPAVRELIRATLDGAGFRVVEAGDGTAALRLLHETSPDAVLLDVMMPGMDGFSVLRAMRQQGLAPGARVVMLTARVEERDYVRGWELGCDDYLTKPFEPLHLARRLRELIATPAEALRARREQELQKAELLDRLESALSRVRPARAV